MKKLKPRSNGFYGWVPDLPDLRDHTFQIERPLAELPASVNLEANCPKVVDQGNLGSCTANAIQGAIGFDQIKQAQTVVDISRLFVYYNERVMEGSVGEDAGAMIRDGVKSVNKLGAPAETDWPYTISKFAAKPPKKAYTNAKKHQVLKYARVQQTLDQLKQTLAGGFPVIFGFSVYESFESQKVSKDGIVPMPSDSEQLLGGHAVLAVGYNDATQRFRVRNSWGTGWGQKGYFEMPYAYLTDPNLSDDFWVLQLLE